MIYYYRNGNGPTCPKTTEEMDENETYKNEVVDVWEELTRQYQPYEPLEGQGSYEYLKFSLDSLDCLSAGGELKENSFLLHGFYNYGYLLLGKLMDSYYIAVPGNYYTREKAVAVMFGFSHFDCGLEEEIPRGTFGYYYRSVTLKSES